MHSGLPSVSVFIRRDGISLRPSSTPAKEKQFTTARKVEAIDYEIAVPDCSGLDVNSPEPKYELKELPGKFSGLNFCVYPYVAFQQIAPEKNVGIDFSREHATALTVHGPTRLPADCRQIHPTALPSCTAKEIAGGLFRGRIRLQRQMHLNKRIHLLSG